VRRQETGRGRRGLASREPGAARGLAVSLADFDSRRPLRVRRAFNPLLFSQPRPPVPADVERSESIGATVITGPNSGGKTRLLQTLGLCQVLGQSGLWVPAAEARLPLIEGLFVSLVESETSDQAEGRLGREMLRIRGLFEGG